MERTTPGSDAVPVVLSGGPRWLLDVNWQPAEDSRNNCIVYSKGGQLWCTTSKPLVEGEVLHACPLDASLQPSLSPGGGGGGGLASALSPAGEGMYPARLLDSIQLLPQQAAMAAILPNAIVNKDIFPCKTCGIWFRSERNLQAHLMYYCSGRQREADPTTTITASTTMLGLTSAEQRTSSKTTGSHVGPRVCPFPQCTISFTGTHALEMHLLTHNSTRAEDPMSSVGGLKCTICSHTADTLMSLQQHILSHLSQVGVRCEHCNFCFQTPAELARHQDMHGHGGPVKVPRDGDAAHHRLLSSSSSSPTTTTSSSTVSPQAGHKPENPFRKESRQSPGRSKETGSGEREQSTMTESHSGSHQASFSYTRVKSEPSSPRQASSPVQPNITPAFPPMGPFMPPHVPFPQDLAGAPQASEILAKMSELVHRRLRHGGGGGTGGNGVGGGGNTGGYPPMVAYSNLVPKGATCFECNISFSNLDNYLVHKKHYCNSRWQQQMAKQQHEYSSLLDQVAAAAAATTDAAGSPRNGSSLVGMLSAAGHPPELKAPHHHHQQHQHQVLEPGRLPSSMFDPFQVGVGGGKLPGDLSPQGKKASTPTTTTTITAEERQNGIQADMKSPVSPGMKSELHPSSTTCEQCNITFSRHETYNVHKQYYCATRHDPPMKRANAMKGPGGAQKAVRARKRRKAYEINAGGDQDHHHMPPHMAMPPPSFLGIPALGNPCLTQQAMETFRDQFHMRYNLYHQSMVPKHPEASLTVAKSALVSKCNAVVSSSREDLDAPMDLSKKCLPPPPPPPPPAAPPAQFNKLSQSPTSLMDYHECSVCKISFNKVQDYLAHKQNFCPGASVDSKLLLDIKKESGTQAVSPSRSLEVAYNNSNNKAGSPEIAAPQNARVQAAKAVTHQNAAGGNAPAKEDSKDTSFHMSTGGYPGMVKKMRPDEQIWPYYEIKAADYPSGMLLMPNDQREQHRKSPNEGSEGEPKDQPAPAPTPVPGREQTHSPTKNNNNNDDKTLDMNGYHKSEEEKPSEDSGKPNGSPPREEPSSATSDPESPVRPGDTTSSASSPPPPLVPSKTEEVPAVTPAGAKRGANGAISSGNVKYCRPCDIQFNNLSNFITHKKFYCSSHTAEHVK